MSLPKAATKTLSERIDSAIHRHVSFHRSLTQRINVNLSYENELVKCALSTTKFNHFGREELFYNDVPIKLIRGKDKIETFPAVPPTFV